MRKNQRSVFLTKAASDGSLSFKLVLNWANVCSPEHALDTSTNYDSFLN